MDYIKIIFFEVKLFFSCHTFVRRILCVGFPFMCLEYSNLLYASIISCMFVSIGNFVASLLRFNSLICVEFFCLPNESNKILSYAPLFYSFQNPIIHWLALTFGDHIMDIKSRISGSLSFLFGQILVRAI